MDEGWWSVKLCTAFVLVLLALIVRFNWDAVKDGFRQRRNMFRSGPPIIKGMFIAKRGLRPNKPESDSDQE